MFLLIKDSEIDEEDEDDDKKNVSSQLRSSPQYSGQKRWKKKLLQWLRGNLLSWQHDFNFHSGVSLWKSLGFYESIQCSV